MLISPFKYFSIIYVSTMLLSNSVALPSNDAIDFSHCFDQPSVQYPLKFKRILYFCFFVVHHVARAASQSIGAFPVTIN